MPPPKTCANRGVYSYHRWTHLSSEAMAFMALIQQGQCYARAYADLLIYCGGSEAGCSTEEAARELRRHFMRAGRAEGRVWGCAGTTLHRPFYSPVSSRRGEALAPGLRVHLQRYLNAVYPTAVFDDADVEDLADVFRTRMYFYETFTSDVSDDYPNPPWSALEPNLAKEAGCNDAGECRNLEALVSCNSGATGLVKIGQARAYHELVPCVLGQDCVRRLRDYVPHYAQDIEARSGEDVWLEVLHMGHTAWWGTHAPTIGKSFLTQTAATVFAEEWERVETFGLASRLAVVSSTMQASLLSLPPRSIC